MKPRGTGRRAHCAKPKDMKRVPQLLIPTLALACSFFGGCSLESAKARASQKLNADNAKDSAKTPAWNWENYPPVTRMRVATLPCQLQPKSTIGMISPLMGSLRVYATAPQTNLPAGYLWAEFEPEIFAAEQTALKDAEKKLQDQEQ